MTRLVVGAIIGLCLLATALKSAVAAVPILNEGELKLDGAAYEGPGYFKTVITDASGTSVWSNDGSSVAGSEPTASVLVSIRSGSFSFVLGDPSVAGVNPLAAELFRSESLFLKTWWSANPAGPFQVIQTARFGGAPWAIGSEWSREVIGSALRTFPSGKVGINVSIEPSNALHVRGDALFEQQLRNDPSSSTLEVGHLKQVTETGTFFNIATYSRPTIEISPGTSDLGFSIAGRFYGLRDQNEDAGSLSDLRGVDIAYGHYSNLQPNAHTDTAIGLLLRPYHGIGTIGNSYALKIDAPWLDDSTEATVRNAWGIYQEGSSLRNFFAGPVGIGVREPESQLHVAGAIRADSLNFLGGATISTNPAGVLTLKPSATSLPALEVQGAIRFADGTLQSTAATGGSTVPSPLAGPVVQLTGNSEIGSYINSKERIHIQTEGGNVIHLNPFGGDVHVNTITPGNLYVRSNIRLVAEPAAGAYITSSETIFVQAGSGSSVLHLNPNGGDVAVNALKPGNLLANGSIRLPTGASLHSDQGGSLELGGDDGGKNANDGARIPYIDFHFDGKNGDFDTRIINNQSGVLSLVSASGPVRLNVQGDIQVNGNGPTGQAQISAPNRLVIQADENLYLNPFQSSDPSKQHSVIVGAGAAQVDLIVTGTTTTKTLEITGGADFAERFSPMGDAHKFEPGTVVSYASDGSQRIEIPSNEYDPKVAGIISGADGIRAGISLGQKGTVADGTLPVAMTGRVRCMADASYGSIQVGDLLTTSRTPGHAMKASDRERAFGAILGKAISNLDNGMGWVWVNVMAR